MIKYKDYIIEPDIYGGYILRSAKPVKNKSNDKDYYRVICYPSSVKHAIEKIVELEFSKGVKEKDYTLEEALAILERIKEELKDISEYVEFKKGDLLVRENSNDNNDNDNDNDIDIESENEEE